MNTLFADQPVASAPQRVTTAPAPDALQPALMARVLDEIDHGLLLLDLTGRIVHMNHPARRELAAARGLRCADGLLRSVDTAANLAIRRALSEAARDCRGIVEIDHPTDPLTLAFIPLAPLPGGGIDTVLVMCSKRATCATLTLQMFARAKRLTKAEQGVLAQLCAGHAAQEIAAFQGICLSTVRTHIKSVRQKTGATSIREVVQRIACMPQVVSALRIVQHD